MGLDDKLLEQISQVAKMLAPLQSDSNMPGDIYLSGELKLMHADGWQIGTFHTVEDWWEFDVEQHDA